MAGNPPVAKYKIGSIEIAKWQGEYNGKPTYSFTISKSRFNKQTNKSENTPFFNLTDLPLLIPLINKAMADKIDENNQPRQQVGPQQMQQQNWQPGAQADTSFNPEQPY